MACEAPYQTHMLSDEALRQQYVRLVAKRHLFRILLPGQEFIDNSDHVQASCYFNEENCNRRQWRVVKYAIEFVFKEQMWKIIEALATQLRGRGEMQGCEAQKIMQTALGEDSTPMVVIP
jgi:hypothetical protein